MDNRNLGKFEVKASMIRDNTKGVAKVFHLLNFIPVRAEYIYYKDAIEYIGISDQFEKVAPGVEPPEYDLKVVKDHDGNIISVKAIQRREE